MRRAAWGVLIALAGAAGCANPLPPTGGPEDRQPPRLVRAVPDTNAVNVAAGTVRLVFSEPLDEASVARSLSVTPDLDRPPSVTVRRRREVVVALGPLRPNTTYVLSFDAQLRDERGVPLDAPLAYAFSTGPRISRGSVSGRVVDAGSGQGVGGIDVYAYAGHAPAADSLPARPDVRTQTGPDGRFRLAYLSPAPLYVVAVEDRNRNRRADTDERTAAPPAPQIRPAETPDDSTALRWTLGRADTASARPERVRSFSPTRHAVRYDRPVWLRDVAAWSDLDPATGTLRDSSAWRLRSEAGAPALVRRVWRDPRDARQVVFETRPLPPAPHALVPGPVADSLGRPARATLLRFTPSTAADTLRTRFVGFSDARVAPDSAGRRRPRVDFSRVPPGDLGIAVADTAGQAQPFALARVDDGAGYWIDTALPAAVSVAVGDSVYRRRFDALDDRTLGSLSGVVARPEGVAGRVYVDAEGDDGRRVRVAAAPDGTFVVPRLPAGPYRLVAFLDRDGDGRWTPGRLAPYRPAEPLGRLDAPQEVRARWEAALPDTLRLD